MVWTGLPRFFTTLTYRQQRHLHDYYLSDQQLSEDQLRNHRAKMADERPALASAAGKAFRQLERTYLEVTTASGGDPDRLNALLRSRIRPTVVGAPNKKGRRITATAQARPQIDIKALTRAIVLMAREEFAAKQRAAEIEADAHDEAA